MASRKERETDDALTFDGGYHLYAKEKHKERVAKTPQRVKYAVERLKENGIDFEVKNEYTGHFHCWRKSDNKLFQFFAGTGKIMGYDRIRGIHSLIRLLKKGEKNADI